MLEFLKMNPKSGPRTIGKSLNLKTHAQEMNVNVLFGVKRKLKELIGDGAALDFPRKYCFLLNSAKTYEESTNIVLHKTLSHLYPYQKS